MKNILEVDSIQKSFENVVILSDVYLKCETGDVVGVLGRNGCGKSTLLKIIFGILKTEHKFVRIDTKVRKKAYRYQNEISYLSQDSFIPNYFKVAKAIQLFINKNRIEEFYNDELIQSIKGQRISQLSSGEIRYLEIKLILYNDSKFALLDEPYNGISPVLIKKINHLILERSTYKGIILTDHNYKNVLKVASQIYLLKDCAMRKLKAKEELISYGYLKEGML